MNKIIILTLMLSFLMISCGKKGDPVYQDPKKKFQDKIFFQIKYNEIY